MKPVYLIVLSFFILASCTKKSNEQAPREEIPGSVISQYEHDPDLQYVKVMGPNQRVNEEGDLYKGQRQGAWISYYDGVAVKDITSYKAGIKQGPYFSFSNTGEMKEKTWYANNQLNGRYVKYQYRSIIEEKFYEHGKLNGTVKIYYPGNKIKESSVYVDGKIEGKARWYDQEGNVSIESTYDKGKLVEQKTGAEIIQEKKALEN